MKWLLIYTHAYDMAIDFIKQKEDWRYRKPLSIEKLNHYESVLRFIEKRIKLIQL